MEYRHINKIINRKELVFIVLVPLLLLFLCLKGINGNFDTPRTFLNEYNTYDRNFNLTGHPFEFSRTRSLYMSTISFANEQSFSFSNSAMELFARGDVGFTGNDIFSWAQPGTAFVGSFFFKVGSFFNLGQLFTYSSILFTSLFVHILLYFIIKKISDQDFFSYEGAFISYIYTFATIALVYSTTYTQHPYTILFISIILFAIIDTIKKHRYGLWGTVVPLIYGFSIFFDYFNIILLAPVAIAWILISYEINKKNNIKIKFILFTLMGIISMLFFQKNNFNSFMQLSNTLPSYEVYVKQPDLFNEKRIQKNSLSHIFTPEKILNGIKTYFIDNKKSIFAFSPILIFSLFGIKILWKQKRRFLLLVLMIFFTNIFFYSLFKFPEGGSSFAVRYLLPSFFCLSILTGYALLNAKKYFRIIGLLLLFISIANNTAGALTTFSIPRPYNTTYYGIKNLEFVINNVSGSFVYNYFFRPLPLLYYFLAILFIIILTMIYFIFSKRKLQILSEK